MQSVSSSSTSSFLLSRAMLITRRETRESAAAASSSGVGIESSIACVATSMVGQGGSDASTLPPATSLRSTRVSARFRPVSFHYAHIHGTSDARAHQTGTDPHAWLLSRRIESAP